MCFEGLGVVGPCGIPGIPTWQSTCVWPWVGSHRVRATGGNVQTTSILCSDLFLGGSSGMMCTITIIYASFPLSARGERGALAGACQWGSEFRTLCRFGQFGGRLHPKPVANARECAAGEGPQARLFHAAKLTRGLAVRLGVSKGRAPGRGGGTAVASFPSVPTLIRAAFGRVGDATLPPGGWTLSGSLPNSESNRESGRALGASGVKGTLLRR